MRDIRKDLQERINLLTDQMRSEQVEFDREVEEIEREHQTHIKGLEADLDAVHKLIGAEQRRMGDAQAVSQKQPQAQAPKVQPGAQPKAQQPQPAAAQPAKPKTRLPLSEMLGLQRAS